MTTQAAASASHSGTPRTAAAHLSHNHIPALDGLRGFAALIVMVFHFQFPLLHVPILGTALTRLHTLGQTGVDLFFVLSGFLITGILLDAKGAPGYLRNFYMRRILRIFPLYYATVLIYYLVPPLFFHKPFYGHQFLVYMCYAQSIPYVPDAQLHGITAFWSLAVEEHFYLLWPMLVLLFPEKQLRYALLLIIAGAIGSRVFFVSQGIEVFFLTPCRMDAIALGSLLAILQRNAAAAAWLGRNALRIFLAAILVFGPIFVVMSGTGNAFQQVYKYSIVAILYAALLLVTIAPASLARGNRPITRFFCTKTLRTVGKFSYGSYVFHPFIYIVIDDHLPAPASVHGLPLATITFLRFALAVFLTFAAAWISWQIYEKQFLKLKKYFEYRPAKSAAKPATAPP